MRPLFIAADAAASRGPGRFRTLARTIPPLLAVALVATMCSSGKPHRNASLPPPSSESTTPPASGSGFPSPQAGVYPLGIVREGPALNATVSSGDGADCLPGDTCRQFLVDCSAAGVPQRGVGFLSIGQPQGSPKGVVMLFSGGGGSKLWSLEAKNDLAFSGQSDNPATDAAAAKKAAGFVDQVHRKGLMTVEVRWKTPWLTSPSGNEAGPARMACRPATVIDHVFETYVKPLGVNDASGRCGFCLSGNSGGSSAIAYSLAFYGVGPLVNGVVLTGGPPHAALVKTCTNVPGYEYPLSNLKVLDSSYGFLPGGPPGPCATHDPSWADVWKRDGVDTGGNRYSYPGTAMLLLLGGLDTTNVGPHQVDYLHKLRSAGADVKQVTIPDMTHAITASDEGLHQIQQWFVG
jgi:hypothetical protein